MLYGWSAMGRLGLERFTAARFISIIVVIVIILLLSSCLEFVYFFEGKTTEAEVLVPSKFSTSSPT